MYRPLMKDSNCEVGIVPDLMKHISDKLYMQSNDCGFETAVQALYGDREMVFLTHLSL